MPDDSRFLQERLTGVGGSDMPVILGLSPWKSPLELYHEKRGEIAAPDLSDNDQVHFGVVLEDVVAKEYARRRSQAEGREVKVRRVNTALRHKEHPFLIAHIDRDVLNESRILECKTADKWTAHKWGAPGTDEVPEPYIAQAHHYLTVADEEQCDLAVLIGGNDFRIYHIRRDPEWSAIVINAAGEFWTRVQEGRPPEPDYNAHAIDVAKRLYPGTDGSTLEANAELEHWRGVYEDATRLATQYGKAADLAKAHLLFTMKQAAILRFGDGSTFERKLVKRKGFTVEASEYVDGRMKKPKDD